MHFWRHYTLLCRMYLQLIPYEALIWDMYCLFCFSPISYLMWTFGVTSIKHVCEFWLILPSVNVALRVFCDPGTICTLAAAEEHFAEERGGRGGGGGEALPSLLSSFPQSSLNSLAEHTYCLSERIWKILPLFCTLYSTACSLTYFCTTKILFGYFFFC